LGFHLFSKTFGISFIFRLFPKLLGFHLFSGLFQNFWDFIYFQTFSKTLGISFFSGLFQVWKKTFFIPGFP